MVGIVGWRITIFNDCDDLDYCEACVSPDGRRWSFDWVIETALTL